MLGGGHAARQVDPITPISPKAIRGHLRFWWRTMCAPDLENPTEISPTELMAVRESEVFGGHYSMEARRGPRYSPIPEV